MSSKLSSAVSMRSRVLEMYVDVNGCVSKVPQLVNNAVRTRGPPIRRGGKPIHGSASRAFSRNLPLCWTSVIYFYYELTRGLLRIRINS